MPRLLSLRPWLGLAFLASAGIACLNPQPEPPVESAALGDPGDRGNEGTASGSDGPGKGSGAAGGSGATGGYDPVPDPDDEGDGQGQGGDSGEFGGGSAGTTGSNAGGEGGRGGVMPPATEGGAGGSTDTPGDPGGAAGAGGDGAGDPEVVECGSCSDVLERGGTPCPGAVAKLAALVSCCHETCNACKQRLVRGDRIGRDCQSCLADACAEALQACKAD